VTGAGDVEVVFSVGNYNYYTLPAVVRYVYFLFTITKPHLS
jgi:hypothetical protein